MTPTVVNRLSVRRAARLSRWNTILLSRNRMAFFYAAVFPVVPLALLFTGDRGDASLGASTITTCFLIAALFTVYYNVLSQFVSRRDELVLKRMRTGEARDAEPIGPDAPCLGLVDERFADIEYDRDDGTNARHVPSR